MQNLVTLTGKKVMIAGTSYPFTLSWNDYTNNILDLSSQLIPDYPATPDGQLNFSKKIRFTIEQNSRGISFCYWGGEYIAFKGTYSTNGSDWENQALFDFNNTALPALEVFNK